MQIILKTVFNYFFKCLLFPLFFKCLIIEIVLIMVLISNGLRDMAKLLG